MRRALCLVPLAILMACGPADADGDGDPTRDSPAAPFGGGSTPAPGAGGSQAGPVAPATDADLTEVVSVMIDGDRGLCTGTLISPTVVITAAHCLDRAMFQTWDVVAPLAGGKKSRAVQVRMFDDDYEDVAHPDIGAIVLGQPITLDDYAQLTDVTARVDGEGKAQGAAMVRKYVDSEAPLKLIPGLEMSSGAPFGYDHGLVTKFFSEGGDSGAGLFLVENGKRTHKLVGVARQPEPDKDLDHFTRIDASFVAWVKNLND